MVDINTIVDNKDEKYNRHIYKPFKNCELSDFTDKGFPADDTFKSTVNSLLCLDLSQNPEQFMVEGKYTNSSYRQSFSIEISVCNQSLSNCKPEAEIQRFLSAYYFTLYNL